MEGEGSFYTSTGQSPTTIAVSIEVIEYFPNFAANSDAFVPDERFLKLRPADVRYQRCPILF